MKRFAIALITIAIAISSIAAPNARADNGQVAAGVAGGLLGGLLLGGALAPRPYYQPAPVYVEPGPVYLEPRLVTLFASVPLTDERWEPLAEGELVTVAGGQLVARQLANESPIFYEQHIDQLALS